MNTHKIADMLFKADLISSISRILKLNVDDKLVDRGSKLLDLLDKLEVSKESTLVEAEDLVKIKEKVKKSMEALQESMEDLFSLHERLIRESEMEQT